MDDITAAEVVARKDNSFISKKEMIEQAGCQGLQVMVQVHKLIRQKSCNRGEPAPATTLVQTKLARLHSRTAPRRSKAVGRTSATAVVGLREGRSCVHLSR